MKESTHIPDGLLLVRKPAGCTSHDIVVDLRRILGRSRIGHFGTLDPGATGLLLIGVGRAVRLFPFFSRSDKSYRGIIRLGFSTDTYDAEGKRTSAIVRSYPPPDRIRECMSLLEGDLLQMPPPYSAKKFKGRRLHSLARDKKDFVIRPSRIHVYRFCMTSFHPPDVAFETDCSSGTYVRSLAHDLGQSMKTGAHLKSLERFSIGSFQLEDAHDPDEIDECRRGGRIESMLIPLDELLPEFPALTVDEEGAQKAVHGNYLNASHLASSTIKYPDDLSSADIFRIFNNQGRLLGLAQKKTKDGDLHPFLVLRDRI